MPKRRSRSVYSGSPRKTPRKSNPNNSVDDGKDEEKRPPNVTLYFKDEDEDAELIDIELEANPLDVLVCVDKEESANENQVPCQDDHDHIFTNRSLQSVSSCSTTLKRASPLSPTLLDNVQQPHPHPTPLSNSSIASNQQNDVADSSLPNDVVPKIEIETTSSVPTAALGTTEELLKSRLLNGPTANNAIISEEPPKVEVEGELGFPEGSSESKETSQNQIQKQGSSESAAPGDGAGLPEAVCRVIDDYHHPEVNFIDEDSYLKWVPRSKVDICKDVEYELDDMDFIWLEIINDMRANYHGLDLGGVKSEEMELLMDRFEKEYYYEQQNNGMGQPAESDEDAVCCICMDGESDNSNQIIFCDMCNIPVHQDCYGVPFIPEGSWLCRRCCSIGPDADIDCIFCPIKDGAFKQTTDGRWSHVLCALWIPEVRFANPSLVEPVDDICDIPPARWKLTCFLCKKKGVGACIQCHLRSCVTAFHPACAQRAGLSLKLETKESNSTIMNVRMKASCDKHTSDKTRELLMEKVETVNKVLNEKKSDQPEKLFPSVPLFRIEAISELVTFPGKSAFIRRLNAYWKLKRKHRGGAPLLRNLESAWIPNEAHPFGPSSPLESSVDPELVTSCFKNMYTMRGELENLRERTDVLKSHCQVQREDLDLQWKILELQMLHVNPFHLQVIQQLKEKDKKEIFAEPVTDDDAPDYSTIIQHPMDLSSMEKKVFALEYSSLEDLEADFLLMVNNCMTYNKKSTPFYRSAIKMKEDGEKIFDEARTAQQRQIEREEQLETEERNARERLHDLLLSTVEKLAKHDTYAIFKEPVDPEQVPDYATIIKEPMDFSQMRKKISEDEYKSIEELEADFTLMINNCFEFNDDRSQYYKIGRRMQLLGQRIFKEIKPSSPRKGNSEDNNNNDDLDMSGVSLEDVDQDGEGSESTDDEEFLFEVLSDTFSKLVKEDDDGVFLEPVDVEECPDYLEVVKSPMDFSTMEKKLKAQEYATLEDMENDYNLMITNCKLFNPRSSEYYGIAVDMKKVGDMIFRKAKKLLKSKCRKT